LAIHEINIVLVVKFIRRSNIQHGCVIEVSCGANFLEIVGKGFVHCRILGWIEAVSERAAVTYTNGVATGQGYHVGGIQALGGER
jgi:hypothetical protein